MQANRLTEKHSVSGQIEPSDVEAIKAAGFTAIICNRPDDEMVGQPKMANVAAAAEAAGLAFHANPMAGGTLPGEIVEKQGEILRGTDAPVLAYCASGRRSTALWMLSNPDALDADERLRRAAEAGYDLEMLRPQL
jgi:uncharacterized protein (TIGR01244 family)